MQQIAKHVAPPHSSECRRAASCATPGTETSAFDTTPCRVDTFPGLRTSLCAGLGHAKLYVLVREWCMRSCSLFCFQHARKFPKHYIKRQSKKKNTCKSSTFPSPAQLLRRTAAQSAMIMRETRRSRAPPCVHANGAIHLCRTFSRGRKMCHNPWEVQKVHDDLAVRVRPLRPSIVDTTGSASVVQYQECPLQAVWVL